MNSTDAEALRAHVADLELQLHTAKALLGRSEAQKDSKRDGDSGEYQLGAGVALPISSSIHNLLLLADSALPLGSFAYSSGLESYLAHQRANKTSTSPTQLFDKFLSLSIQSIAHSTVPYMLACFRDPLALMDLDNDLDASTPCTVARRASIAQGRALLSVWERAFYPATPTELTENAEVATALSTFSSDLRLSAISTEPLPVNGHLAPLWGAVSLNLGLNLEEAGYVFLLSHAKAVISAGVRASVMGPYQAQTILASHALQTLIRQSLERVWLVHPEDAGQVVPVMDLWIGRHELLYSRIFNS